MLLVGTHECRTAEAKERSPRDSEPAVQEPQRQTVRRRGPHDDTLSLPALRRGVGGSDAQRERVQALRLPEVRQGVVKGGSSS